MTGPAKISADTRGVRPRIACVLFHAPGAPVPTDLLAALGKRIRHITTFSDAYTAFAEACVLARASTVVLVLVEPSTLADADQLVRSSRLHLPAATIWHFSQTNGRALRKLAPTDVIPWSVPSAARPEPPPAAGPRLASTLGPDTPRLKPGGASAFRPAARNAKPANDPPRIVVRPGGGIGIRRLRLVGDELPAKPAAPQSPPANGSHAPVPGAPDPAAAEPSAPAPLLTEEELRMLLSDDDPGSANGGTERSTR